MLDYFKRPKGKLALDLSKPKRSALNYAAYVGDNGTAGKDGKNGKNGRNGVVITP